MKSLIVTVAGTARRFNKDLKSPMLKCIYNDNQPNHSLLAQIVFKAQNFDQIVIVGGYLFDELCEYVKRTFADLYSKIDLVYNPLYKEWGSGYSLIKGIEAINADCKEVVFVEGDLFFDTDSFLKVVNAVNNVLTITSEPIRAQKSVVLYTDLLDRIHYLYDISHSYLEIEEPFKAIYNSGQIWKFVDVKKLRTVVSTLTKIQTQGTNLVIIQKYLDYLSMSSLEVIPIKMWYNCNTVEDYYKVNHIIHANSKS